MFGGWVEVDCVAIGDESNDERVGVDANELINEGVEDVAKRASYDRGWSGVLYRETFFSFWTVKLSIPLVTLYRAFASSSIIITNRQQENGMNG